MDENYKVPRDHLDLDRFLKDLETLAFYAFGESTDSCVKFLYEDGSWDDWEVDLSVEATLREGRSILYPLAIPAMSDKEMAFCLDEEDRPIHNYLDDDMRPWVLPEYGGFAIAMTLTDDVLEYEIGWATDASGTHIYCPGAPNDLIRAALRVLNRYMADPKYWIDMNV